MQTSRQCPCKNGNVGHRPSACHTCRVHYSGTTLDAQARYAAGTKEILRRTFENEPLNETDVIVQVMIPTEGC